MSKLKAIVLIVCTNTLLLFVFNDRLYDVGSLREEPNRKDMTDEVLEERFQLRRERMRIICDATENREDVINTLETRVLYFWKQNISICTMGKVGSATWRTHAKIINRLNVHPMYDPRRVSLLRQPWERIVSYSHSLSKWITVRHPLTRLVSCYQDKYRNGSSVQSREVVYEEAEPLSVEVFWAKTEDQAFGNLLDDVVQPVEYVAKTSSRPELSITFEEFLKHVVNTFEEGTDNRHWKTYGVLCSPCFFNYDYITKIETQRKDLGYLFRKFSVPSNPKVELKVKMNVNEKMKQDFRYFKNIPMDLKLKIYDIYKIDMAMFGYELPPDFWESPKAQ